MITFAQFVNEFNNLPTDNQVEIFNKFCEDNKLFEQFYPMEMLNEFLPCYSALVVLQSLAEGFDYHKPYIQLDGYGNYASFNMLEVREYIIENGYITQIFENENLWSDKIDSTIYEEDEEEED